MKNQVYSFAVILSQPDILNHHRSRELIEVSCDYCKKVYPITKHNIQRKIQQGKKQNFCSNSCGARNQYASQRVAGFCSMCSKPLERSKSQIPTSGKIFCNNSCAATYNNTHKKYGTRRSKLELHLESIIRTEFPELEVVCNGKDVIESELDFYFPELRFAIELNGILHYEPIYGQDKFDRIQNNDKQKLIRCYEKGIELAVIDVSKVSYLTEKIRSEYASIVKELLTRVVSRVRIERTTKSLKAICSAN